VRNSRRWVAALGILALAGAMGCGDKTIRFGAVLPLTGYAEVYGQAIRKGIELAFEQAKQNPDLAGRLELTIVDSGSDAQRAKNELSKLYGSGVMAAIGGVTSAEALAMVEEADDDQRTLVSPSASSPQLTGISSNFFRVFPSDFSEGTVMARYAYDNLRLRVGVVLAKEETFAKGIQKVFSDEFQRKGGRIEETIEYPEGTSDFAALCERVVTLKPDFVYLAAYANDLSKMIEHLRRLKFAGIVLTTSSFAAAETIEKTGAAAEGTYYAQTSFDVDGQLAPQVAEFVKSSRARYGHDPDLYAAHGYDAFNILIEAYRQGGTSGLSFWKGMRNIHEFPGVTGSLQFDEKGDVGKFPHVYVVTDGKAVDVEQQRQKQIEEARRKMREIEESLRNLQKPPGQ
jgi:branched-chain amino acid transport system substrate-binding protein